MKLCPACGGDNEDGARFCLECGESFEDVVDEPTDPWLGRMVSGRFRIVRKLGDGGMGEVYLAEQLPMGREIALKVLRQHLADDPQAVERFKREAQAASQLAHPNTIIVYDFGQDAEDGTLFLAMELLEGLPLDEVISREETLSPERTVAVLSQVCGSLQEAHDRGMVHRDLKPENIFLTERGGKSDFVKVLDFGIAKVTQSSKGDRLETITRQGAVFGTPQYMSPEQIRGEDLDARADVYALGVMLYEMISGHLPFDAGTVMELLTQHLSAAPAPISRGPAPSNSALARLEAVAMRALSKDPAQRQPSARAFLEDLMAAMPDLALNPVTNLVPVTAGGPAAVLEAPGGAGGRSVPVILLAALLAGGAVAAWFATNGGPGDPADAAPLAALAPDQEAAPAAAEDAKPAEGAADAKPAEAKPADAAAEPEEKEPTAEEKAAAAKVEAEAEAEVKAAEEEEKAAEKGDTLSEAEAKAIAEKAEAEEKAAQAEAETAKAEEKAAKAEAAKKAAEEKAAANAAAKKEAEAKAAADAAAKKEAEAKVATAQMEKAAAQAKAQEAKAATEEAKAKAAKAIADAEAQKKKIEADAAKAKAEADAARKKAEEEAAKAKAELAEIRAAQAEAKAKAEAAKAAQEEAKKKAAEAKAKKKAAKKRKRAKSQWGKVFVKSKSARVKIYVDGKIRGRTPMKTLRVKAGTRTIEARKGKKKQKRKVKVKKGEVKRVNFSL